MIRVANYSITSLGSSNGSLACSVSSLSRLQPPDQAQIEIDNFFPHGSWCLHRRLQYCEDIRILQIDSDHRPHM
jgi:hypothetical protein